MKEFNERFTEILHMFSEREEISIFNAILLDDINEVFNILERKLQHEYSPEVDHLYSLLPGQTISRPFLLDFSKKKEQTNDNELKAVFFYGECMN